MNNANRVIFNSIVLYAKIIINIFIALFSVPIVMHALGKSDFGLYNLVAGVIGLLAFLRSSMTISTQRFISVAIGENHVDRINSIYNTSIVLHIIIGIIIVAFLELFSLFIFDGFLNIESDRVSAAKIVYQFLVVTTFLEVACVPYEGVINAKEDMLTFSIVGIASAILKLILALYLMICGFDRLIMYGLGMAIISLLTITTYIVFTRIKYKELIVRYDKYFDKKVLKELFGFTSWNTFGSIALLGRNQGVAIILNKFFGTVLNASYGVANQVNGVMGYFSNSFHKAINPQLMKSHGQGDNERMIRLAMASSKFSVLVMAALTVPLIVEMPYILKIWLKTPPVYTAELCSWILILSMVNQYSAGLMSSISSTGKIMKYQIIMSILIITNIPLSYITLKLGFPPYYCTIGFVVIEVISLCVRIIMARSLVGLTITGFINDVVKPTFISILIPLIPTYLCHIHMEVSLMRTITIFGLFISLFVLTTWHCSLNPNEKMIFSTIFNKIKRK